MTKARLQWRNQEWSIAEIAKLYRINRRTLGRRILELRREGIPVEEAIELALNMPIDRFSRIEINGEVRSTLAWMKHYGISKAAFSSRIRRGREGKALIAPITKPQGLTAFDKTQSYAAWSREKGISASTLRDRVVNMGMKPELALTMPVGNHKK